MDGDTVAPHHLARKGADMTDYQTNLHFNGAQEEWRVIADFPDYAVSDKGRVRRITPTSRGARRMNVLKNILTSHGYHQVNLYLDGKGKIFFVHTLVCQAFNSAPRIGQTHVAHGDGSKTNNTKENLRWASSSENEADKATHGTVAKGESSGVSKLTDELVRAIRSDMRSQRKIARDYGITQANVSFIKLRKSWAHVE